MNATPPVAWDGRESRTETSFQNLRYQQNLESRRIAIVELSTNDLRRIERAAEALCLVVANVRAGEFRQLEIE